MNIEKTINKFILKKKIIIKLFDILKTNKFTFISEEGPRVIS
jgi:hypothetical protein